MTIDEMYSDLVSLIFMFEGNSYFKRETNGNKRRPGKDKIRPGYTSECQTLKRLLKRAEQDYKNDPFNKCKQGFLFSTREKIKICAKNMNVDIEIR